MNFTESIHADLAARFDDDTANYLIDTALRIQHDARLIDDDPTNSLDPLDPTDDDDFELIDDMIQQLIEPACTFSPLPASIADLDDTAILMMIDAILRTLIHHYLFLDPDDAYSEYMMRNP